MKKILSLIFTLLMLYVPLVQAQQIRVLSDAPEFEGKINTSQRKSLIIQNETNEEQEYVLKFLRGNVGSSQNLKVCLGDACFDPRKDLAKIKFKLNPGEIYTDLYLEFELGISEGKGNFDLHFVNTKNIRETFMVEAKYNVSNPGGDGNEVDHRDIRISSVYPNPSNRIAQLDYEIKNPRSNATILVNSFIGNPVQSFELNPNANTLVINVADLDPGIYFYTLIVDNKNIFTKKLVVKR
ncbi:T9SS type A sorting domain-containing protein [Pararhodonellum marinum]|uniref:T9SS type A sorting domain-containing protein n=1 Tax=Pararhodonellum marinum TaxID=2755358 RepID=UPI00188F755E|nr:T9SS type A sorting domain-containing protein [Pararhodonellum marinum]